jgi:hypothetical protein
MILCSCSQAPTRFSENNSQRKPGSLAEPTLSSAALKKLSPLQVLEMLRDHGDTAILFEPTKIRAYWSEADANILKQYLKDEHSSAPSASVYTQVYCSGQKYISTVGREAFHLIQAIHTGTYPTCQCSTYDLKLEP